PNATLIQRARHRTTAHRTAMTLWRRMCWLKAACAPGSERGDQTSAVYVQAFERAMRLVALPVLGLDSMSRTIELPSFTVEHLLFVVGPGASGSGIQNGQSNPRNATRHSAINWSTTLVMFT
ncbi:MAG TPA: hypothetical protein VGS80_10130, partial [Ktedonobacterales bacterium]|nr:hypothetical protein [Ktedonobacterales bacterium]